MNASELFQTFVEGFMGLLRASSLGGAAILLMLGLRALLGRALAPGWRCWLWAPVAVLLLMPRLPDLGLHWKAVALPEAMHEATPLAEPGVAERATMEPAAPAEGATASAGGVKAPEPETWSWVEGGAVAWAIVAVALWGLWCASYGILLRRVRRNVKATPEELKRLLAECVGAAGLRRLPRLVVTDALDNPAVAGLFRPLVLVPERIPTLLSEAELRLVLQHEVWHLKRRDLWFHWFSAVLLAVHWFNPLLWLAVRCFRSDREAACDAAVLSSSRGDVRGFYGETLLKLQACLGRPLVIRPVVGVLGGADLLKARILDIANHGRSSRLAAGAAFLFMTASAGGLAIAGSAETKESHTKSDSKSSEATIKAPASEDRNERLETLRRIDELAGVPPLQVYITSRFVTFTGENLRNPVNWFAPPRAGDKDDRLLASKGLPPRAASRLEKLGVLSDAQFQLILRAISQGPSLLPSPETKGAGVQVDWPQFTDAFRDAVAGQRSIASSPSVTTRSGQRATVEVVRDFIYPTTFAREESDQPGGNPKLVPTAFDMVPIGIRMDVAPHVGLDDVTIDLNIEPKISAFLKWQEFKSADGQFIKNPVFGRTSCKTALTIHDGETVVFGGYAYRAAFAAGDLPALAKNPPGDALCPILVFVTAKTIDARGLPAGSKDKKPRGIVIPAIKLQELSLAEAVSQICDLAKENDPRHRGVNVLLRQPEAAVPGITYASTDVTFSQALNQIATMADLDLRVEDNTVLLSPKKGNQKSAATLRKVEAKIGPRSFLKGDRIEIYEINATSPHFTVGDQVLVKGHYELASHEKARLSLYTTHTKDSGLQDAEPSQELTAEKGNHEFTLRCTVREQGYLHLSFFDDKRENFGSVYFGTEKQMQEAGGVEYPGGAVPSLPKGEKPELKTKP